MVIIINSQDIFSGSEFEYTYDFVFGLHDNLRGDPTVNVEQACVKVLNPMYAMMFHSMAKTSLSEKGKQLITETGALRKYLTISYEDNAFLDKGKQRLQAEFWSQ